MNVLPVDTVVRAEVDMNKDSDELLKAVHDAHAPSLLRYVERLTRDHAMAEDIVQETLMRLWNKPKILEQPTEDTRAWLFTVARNLVIDDRRSSRYAHEWSVDHLPDRQSPDVIAKALDTWLLQDALLSLSREHRAAVMSAHYLGHSVAEIARQEGVAEGTIKSRLHYALRALRLALQERGVLQ